MGGQGASDAAVYIGIALPEPLLRTDLGSQLLAQLLRGCLMGPCIMLRLHHRLSRLA
jgi:hypothetical protein